MKRKLSLLLSIVIIASVVLSGCKKGKALSNTVQWINTAYAILITATEGELDEIGGFRKNTISKEVVIQLLEESWEVTDRESAEEKLNWLITEGHRESFKEDVVQLEDAGMLEEGIKREEVEKKLDAYDEITKTYFLCVWDAYQKFGDYAILAWDYCRALQLLGYYYIADLYTEEEVLDQSLEIAKELQNAYTSWEELAQSYLYGCQYWKEDDINNAESYSAKRKKVYEELKSSEENPYTLDWNLSLEKTW